MIMKLLFLKQTPGPQAIPRNPLHQEVNRTTNDHRRDTQIEQNKQPARCGNARLVDIVPENGLEFLAAE